MKEDANTSAISELRRMELRLRRFSAARRHLLNATLGYRLGVYGALASALGIVLMSGWIALAFVNALLSLALLLSLVALCFLGLRRTARFRCALEEAFLFEALEGDLNSRLISALDFLQRDLDTPLTRAVVARAVQDSERDAERKIEPTARNRWRRRFLLAVVVLVVAAGNPWFGLTQAIPTVRQAWFDVFEYFFPLQYEWLPAEEITIARVGEPVELSLRFRGRGYQRVDALITRDEKTTLAPLVPDATGRFVTNLTSAVEAEYRVSMAFGRRQLPERTIIFTTDPQLLNMQAELIYPAYTRMVPRNFEGIQTRLAALPGTRMTLGFTFSKVLESAELEWDDGETLPLDVVGRFAAVSLLHSRERRATLRIVDLHGLSPDMAPVLDFAVQRDEPPRLFVPGHLGEDMPMVEGAVAQFGFGIRAEDDFGVTRCVLTWRQSTVDNPAQVINEGEIERLISPSQRRVVTAFEQVFEGMTLTAGDRVAIEIAAYDNRTPDAQVTRSRPISFFVHQDDLGGLSLDDLRFGGGLSAQRGRIPRARRSTTVAEPDATRTVEQLRVDWDAPIDAPTVAPAVRGEHGQAAQDYFRLLSEVVFEQEDGAQKR